MAVYTLVNKSDLDKLINNYNLGKLLSFEGIKQGVENSNYKIITDQGLFILTIYEKRVNPKDLPYFINFMSYLYKNKIPCPEPMADKKGEFFHKIFNKNCSIVSFLKGKELSKIKLSHCFDLGKNIALLHMAGKNFNQFRKNNLGHKNWKQLYKLCKLNVNKETKELMRLSFDTFEKKWPKTLPLGNIHGDLFKDNVFFSNGKVSGIIDFYFSCRDFWAYDIAIAVNAWCFNNKDTFLQNRASSIISGYNSIRKLNDEELKSFPVLLMGAATRFFLTRLYDWHNTSSDALVTKLNPNEFLNKLKFFYQVKHNSHYNELIK